jgi:hypothetical protein
MSNLLTRIITKIIQISQSIKSKFSVVEKSKKAPSSLDDTFGAPTDRFSEAPPSPKLNTSEDDKNELEISEPISENQPEPERNEIVQQYSVEHDLATPKTNPTQFQLPDTPELIKKEIETNQAHPDAATDLGQLSTQKLNSGEQELTQAASQSAEYLSPKDKSELVPDQHQEKMDQQFIFDTHPIPKIENSTLKNFADQSKLEVSEPISEFQPKPDQNVSVQQSSIENDLAIPKTAQPQSQLTNIPGLSQEQIEINHTHPNSDEDVGRLSMQELGRKTQGTTQISPRIDVSLPSKAKSLSAPDQHRKKRDQLFYFDFHPIPEIDSQILTEFLERGEQGTLKDMVGINPQKVEEFLLNAFNRYDFIGEIPFSKPTFDFFRQIIQQNYIVGKKPKIKQVPPAIYITSMVFCARYSEEDARKFWQPYAKLVWQTDLSQYFQKVCRDHYVQSRDFLLDHFELDYPALGPGEVVRPIYYQAVIPFYLQSTFAQWLISNFEQVLKFSTEDLLPVLQSDNSLDYEPKGFKNFVSGSDTRGAAAKLITQMAKAIKLFQTTEQFQAVNSIMDSPIERSLWREVYDDLIRGNLELEKVRSYAAKLEWVWNMEKMDLGLQLSHVRSQKHEKPNLIVWASKNNQDLITEEHIFDVHPWRLENDDWELETEIIYEFGELDGKVFVLSERYDLEEPTINQGPNIIFQKEIPVFPEAPSFFFIPSIGTIARSKDKINVNGNWIVLSKEEFEIQGQGHKDVSLITSEIHIPVLLQNAGIRYAKQYHLELPVEFHDASGIIEFKQPSSAYIFEATLVGEKPVLELSPRIQPIFTSNQIRVRALANFPTNNFQRIWISIYRANVFSQSISLEDFQQQNLLTIEDNQYLINLSPYIKKSGLYTITILHNLQDLLETPLKFGYLPALNIVGPEPSKCYSPENPATIQISGIPENHIVLPEGEKVKFQKTTTGLQLAVRKMRLPEARFLLQWDGNNIQICYDIERVTAWVEGGGDKGNVMEHQTAEIMLHIRGNSNERYNWVVNGSRFRSDFFLNAKGEFNEALEKTVLRDILRKSKFIDTEIGITIRGQTWRLFTYKKFPKIIIKEVKYQRPNISITLGQQNPLVGSYHLQIRKLDYSGRPTEISTETTLRNETSYDIDLDHGQYILEITHHDEVIAKSNKFEIIITDSQEHLSISEDIFISKTDEFSPHEIYASLSATPTAYQELRNTKIEGLLPILRQLIKVNDLSTWINPDEKLDEFFNQLLPSWVITAYPFSAITKKLWKNLHVFPQKSIYGGEHGKGFMKAKFANGPINLYVAWSTKQDKTQLWLMVPGEKDTIRFCDLEETLMLPCYQCIDCGEIIAPIAMNFDNWAPKTIMDHKHKKHRSVHKQFADVGNVESLQVEIHQYRDEKIEHCDSPFSVIENGFISELAKGKQQAETGEMEIPINPESAEDYKIAISEMVSKYSEKNYELNLKQLIGKHELWKKLELEFSELSSKVSAFNAFFRLYQCLKVPNAFAAIPKHILLLAMLLRYKGHHPQDYKFILDNAGTDERTVIKLTHLAITSCPKLMEWSIFWAEIFFHHTAS